MKKKLGIVFVSVFMFVYLLPMGCFASEEKDEAKRIQITGQGNNPEMKILRIFPVPDDKLVISTWLGCLVKFTKEGELPVLRISGSSDTKPWAGFKIYAPAEEGVTDLATTGDIELVRIIFKVKAPAGVDFKRLQVCVYGKAGDNKMVQSAWRYQPLKSLPPAGEDGWIEVSMRLQDFEKLTELKSVNGIGFQFIGNGPGGEFEITDVYLAKQLSKTSTTSFNIETPNLQNLSITDEKFPEEATNIRINGPDITRNGKPVFLTGVEDDAIVFPWLYRLLGFDIVQLQDFAPVNQIKFKPDGNTVNVSWSPLQKWIGDKIRYLLHNGLAVHINYWDNVPKSSTFKEYFADALSEKSHFYNIRLDHPLGRELREKYLQASLQTLGRYPITFYELYNEIYYGDPSPTAVSAFQDELKKKYSDIASANKNLGTGADSFKRLLPPLKKVNWMVTRKDISPSDVSPELYSLWQKFLERWLGDQLCLLTLNFKSNLKYPYSYVIYQATMGLKEDFSGFTGTNPYELVKAEDALCHEGGMGFYPQEQGKENINEIAKMTRPLMLWDLLKGISRDKPVYLSECTVKVYGKSYENGAARVDLSGLWKFKGSGTDDTSDYEKSEYDDSAWKNLTFPGVWGNQGFADCSRGWLRKHFDMPEKGKGKFFLTGKELADFAHIYLNGKLLHQTKSWNEGFSKDITNLLKLTDNVIALRIDNKFAVDGKIQGGIRDFIAITDKQFFIKPKLTAGQMRSWFWSMAAHDVSGVIMSYFYTPASSRQVGSMYSPKTVSYQAIRAIPEVKKEISSVGDFMLPRPRQQGKVAFVYPFESGRARIIENSNELFSGKITLHMMEYYLSALFSQITPEVAGCRGIIEGKFDKMKALVLCGNKRVPALLTGKLESYVKHGGVLIMDSGSMSFNDDKHVVIPTPEWLGVKTEAELIAPTTVSSEKFGFEKIPVQKLEYDHSYGIGLCATSAQTLATFSDGKPAITVNSYGKGYVYYFACKLPFTVLKPVLRTILESHNITSEIKLKLKDNASANFVEAHLFGRGKKYVLYMNNFGGGDLNAVVACNSIPAGKYSLTDISSGKIIRDNIRAEQLRGGIELILPSQNPLVLLVESVQVEQKTKIQKLSPREDAFLKMWRQSPPGKVKVLVNACLRDEIDPFRMLTGKQLLENEGYEFSYASDLPKKEKIKVFMSQEQTQPLAAYDIYMLAGSRIRDKATIHEISEYVKNGGNLVLTATASVGYFGWMSNNWNRKDLFNAFGLGCTDTNFEDEKNYTDSSYFCIFNNIDQTHPVTNGVQRVQIAGGCPLKKTAENQKVLISSNSDSKPANAPFMIAIEYGKGKVVALSDAQWMEPQWLAKEDNAQLLLNIFDWLSGKQTRVRAKSELSLVINPDM